MPRSKRVIVLDPEQVHIGWRARVELRALDDLARSIEESGQVQPIAVVKNGQGYELIAGHRRLEACRSLGQGVEAVVIKAVDEADAIWKQLTENVQREDFTKLELGEGLRKHKAVYEKLHPGTKLGAPGGRPGGKGPTSKAGFASVAAISID